jgi:hypothetical protein
MTQSPSINSNFLNELADGTNIFSFLTQRPGDSRILRYTRGPAMDDSNTTIPTRWSAGSFWRISSQESQSMTGEIQNGSISVDVAHPVVHAHCLSHKGPRHPEIDIFYTQDDKITKAPLTNLRSLVRQVTGPSEYSDNLGAQFFAPIYMDSPESGSHSTLVVLFRRFPGGANDTSLSLQDYIKKEDPENLERDLYILTCTVSAYWNFGQVQSLFPGGPYVVQTGVLSMSTPHKPRPMKLNFTGVTELQGAKFYRLAADTSPSTSVCLATVYATVIADMNPSLIFPEFTGGLDFDHRPDRTPSNSTTLKYTATRWGYGYNTDGTSTQLSIAVITLYCVVVSAYIVYILVTGSTSTAWNSAIELVALALQSRRPDYLGHIGVGLDSLETLKEGVGIRVNNNNEVELVFSHDRDFAAGNLRKIERNKEY